MVPSCLLVVNLGIKEYFSKSQIIFKYYLKARYADGKANGVNITESVIHFISIVDGCSSERALRRNKMFIKKFS